MNILFFLTPKAACEHLDADDTVRQALERMELSGYTALPVLAPDGTYCGTLGVNDLLWALKNLCDMDMKTAEDHGISEITPRRENRAVSVSTKMEDLLSKAIDQNFVPVVDDRSAFIGIVTRKAIMQHFTEKMLKEENTAAV